ncbi:MAG: hypothetical protein QGH40_12045, partial [bacterium]|nr:hypothetical protein [bacterium]
MKGAIVMEIDYNARKALLQQHIDHFWNTLLSDPEKQQAFLPYLDRGKALYGVLLKNDRFLALAEPVTDETPLEVTQYYMRYDGVFCFLEGVFRDPENREILCANPLRFPYDPRASRQLPYLSRKHEKLFGLEVKTTTFVTNDRGIKDYSAQLEEVRRITVNQQNSRNPIKKFFFHQQGVTQCPVFRRENFLFYFPAKRALKYMLFIRKFEPVVRGTNWLLENGPAKPFASFGQMKLDDLGATGSSSFGDEEDKDDYDVVFYGNQKKLNAIRSFLVEGTRHGVFKPMNTKIKHRIRVLNREVVLECTGKPVLFCPFFILQPQTLNSLKHALVIPRGELKYFEARVLEDSESMLSPSRAIIGDFENVYPRATRPPDGSMLVLTHGAARGELFEGSWISVRNALIAEIHTVQGESFPALISRGWYDVEVM